MIVCGTCGHRNEATDAFCGNCGAFLEWVGKRDEAVPAEPGPTEAPAEPAPQDTARAASGGGWSAADRVVVIEPEPEPVPEPVPEPLPEPEPEPEPVPEPVPEPQPEPEPVPEPEPQP